MMEAPSPIAAAQFEKLTVKIFDDAAALGAAAAADFSRSLKRRAASGGGVSVIFATGASQRKMLSALTSIEGLPWSLVTGFHMDEYTGISDQHPASFRRYLREHLTERVPLRAFYPIDGSAADTEATSRNYAALLQAHSPQLCLLGIGENGHLAFNDPHVADFSDPRDVKVVTLDRLCREQQVHEGWFPSFDDVPEGAITLTVPALLRVPELFASVPGPRKAHIVSRALKEPVSTACPATILRTHPQATLYIDRESAAELQIP
ncbi:MAG: glucosamine-6-phosphate deaminase [Terriglobia bacterium]